MVQYDWMPPAGGDITLIKALNFLRNYEGFDIDEANRKVIAKVVAAQPVLKDNVPAKTVIPQLNENNGKVILHAGPPIEYKDMPATVQCSSRSGQTTKQMLVSSWSPVRFSSFHATTATQ